MHQKSISDVVIQFDSKNNSLECAQRKHSQDWEEIDVHAIKFFSRHIGVKIKCTVGVNVHVKRIKQIDWSNVPESCPLCGRKEAWEHVLSCETQESLREEWIENLKRN